MLLDDSAQCATHAIDGDGLRMIAQMTEQVKSYSGHLGTAALVADEDNPFVHVDPETGEIIENET